MNQPLPLPASREALEQATVPALAALSPIAPSPTPASLEAKRALSLRVLRQLLATAHTLYEHGLFREATDLFRYLTVAAPNNPEHWLCLGQAYYAVGDPLSAARVFELGGRLSHAEFFNALAVEARTRAGYPEPSPNPRSAR